MAGPARKEISKVLLLAPHGQVYLFPDGRPAHRKHCSPPLGLAYLAANLIRHNYDVEVIDMLAEGYDNEVLMFNSIVYGLDLDELVARVGRSKPDVIGISVLFSSVISSVYRVCEALKRHFPDIPIIMGGQHATGAPQEVMKNRHIDYVLRGEADVSFPLFLRALSGDMALDSVPGLMYRQGDSVVDSMRSIAPAVSGEGWNYYQMKDSGVPLELDTLSVPAWKLFPMQRYWAVDARPGSGDAFARKYAVMLSSRGCPHVCYYCTSPLSSSYRGYRRRSIDSIIDEIHWLVREIGVQEVMFYDDNFFVAKPRAKELVRRLALEFPRLYFSVPGGTDVNQLDEEMIDLLAAANFHKITLNIESGNPEIQQSLIDKKVKLGRVPKVIEYLRSKKIETRAMLMIGFPGETRQSIDMTAKLAMGLNVDDFMLSIVCPLPGTPLFDECMAKNLFVEGFSLDQIRYALSVIRLPDTTPEELESIRHSVWMEGFEHRRRNTVTIGAGPVKKFVNVEDYERSGFKLCRK